MYRKQQNTRDPRQWLLSERTDCTQHQFAFHLHLFLSFYFTKDFSLFLEQTQPHVLILRKERELSGMARELIWESSPDRKLYSAVTGDQPLENNTYIRAAQTLQSSAVWIL